MSKNLVARNSNSFDEADRDETIAARGDGRRARRRLYGACRLPARKSVDEDGEMNIDLELAAGSDNP
ncbi:hypothetical protein [Rhizobium sp. RAF56]|uniref:hypothetical protein n=1 Tax=Rhizobium sp. RAF56 TaxID=3233062 RepID=UPI003F97AC33